jgi:5-methylcytosine-specific restriction protein A
MPRSPRKPCRQLGCPNLVDKGKGYCETCRPKADKIDRNHRGSAAERGYDHTWNRLRNMYLRNNPLCVMCDKPEPARVVDHIVPLAQGGERLAESNLQSLCLTHHATKTLKETRG